MATELVTIKVTKNSRTMLRVLAAYAEQDMAVVLTSILGGEIRRKGLDLRGLIKALDKKKGIINARSKRSR